MALLDADGYELRCDRCHVEFRGEVAPYDITFDLWDRTIFKNRPKPHLGDFCRSCAVAVTPLVYALRDADELQYYVNKLERAINEKRRTKNHGAIENNAGECCQGCSEWGLGHRSSFGLTQAGEEYKRFALF